MASMMISTVMTPAKASPTPVTRAAPVVETSIVLRASVRVDFWLTTGRSASHPAGTVSICLSCLAEGQRSGRRLASTTTACS